MAERQNTGNPIPSNELADLNDNCMIVDEFANLKIKYTTDRFGNQLKTIYGINEEFQDIITGTGYLPLSGGTLTGSLTFNGNGRGLYFSPSNHRIISGDGVNLSFDMTGSNGARNGRLDWLTSTDTWNFKNSTVKINNVPILKQGDGGFYGYSTQTISNINEIQNKPSSIFVVNNGTVNGNIGSANLLAMRRTNATSNYWSAISVSVTGNPRAEIFTCENGTLKSAQLITTANVGDYVNNSSSSNNRVEITENGSFTVPDGVNSIYLSAIGGGGGGCGPRNNSISGQAGGAFYRLMVNVIPNQVIKINIGAGGAGTPANTKAQAGSGGVTTIEIDNIIYKCSGGVGGPASSSAANTVASVTENNQIKYIGKGNDQYILGFADLGCGGEAVTNYTVPGGSGNNGAVIIEW